MQTELQENVTCYILYFPNVNHQKLIIFAYSYTKLPSSVNYHESYSYSVELHVNDF
jgi:hypothetical protein